MKGRESGMPEEACWDRFYDAACIVEKLGCVANGSESVVEFGSGYGTFTLPAASRTSGNLFAFDIEPALIRMVVAKTRAAGLSNVVAETRDFLAGPLPLAPGAVDHAMAYNILHIEEPLTLLAEAYRVLKPGGTLSIIHWKCDASTPRGPAMDIRPSPAQCRAWAEEAGFLFLRYQDLSECCDYHYGLVMKRPADPCH
jgi:SAM-dependent methyltransferase